MAGSLLMGSEDVADPAAAPVERIIERDDLAARIAEDGIDTLLDETFDDYIRTCKLQVQSSTIIAP